MTLRVDEKTEASGILLDRRSLHFGRDDMWGVRENSCVFGFDTRSIRENMTGLKYNGIAL